MPAGEDGEICVAGPGVMMGYWQDPEQTAATIVDGWLHTGDVGHLDEDGFLYVVDRVKDLIIRGGFNVFPRDVEDVLRRPPRGLRRRRRRPAGRQERRGGHRGRLARARRRGDPRGADRVRPRRGSAKYKYPREVVIVDAVPLTSVGKTDRKAVRTLVRD